MSRKVRQLALGSVAVLALLAGAVPALAKPVSWSSVDVVLHADPQSPLLIVSGTVPDGTQFPVEGVLAVPTRTPPSSSTVCSSVPPTLTRPLPSPSPPPPAGFRSRNATTTTAIATPAQMIHLLFMSRSHAARKTTSDDQPSIGASVTIPPGVFVRQPALPPPVSLGDNAGTSCCL